MNHLSASILVLVFFAFSINVMAKADNTNHQTKITKKKKKIIALPSVVTEDEGPADELIISGIVLERTISRFGKEFTRQFTQSWQDVPAPGSYRHRILRRLHSGSDCQHSFVARRVSVKRHRSTG